MAFSNVWSSGLTGNADTIVAPATPPGRGALAVVRVSGPGVRASAARVCPGLDVERAWRAQVTWLTDATGDRIERAVVIPYHGPRSYSGEDMLEVIVHGSPAVTGAVMDAFIAAGCRPAQPGEFTRRAVENGKMDLIQAEGIADLVASETRWQMKAARAQVEGRLSGRVQTLREALMGLLARVEATIDFAAQGISVSPRELEPARLAIERQINELLDTAASGEKIRDGFRVAIVGVPNAGKSTLFNALLKSERAIVSPHPGTTRDVIEAEAEIAGLPVSLVDTAGLRAAATAVEVEGVRRARRAAAEADALLVVHGCDQGDVPSLEEVIDGRPWTGILTKTDRKRPPERLVRAGWVPVSLKTGEGFENVERAVERLVGEDVEPVEGCTVINRRHRTSLRIALEEISGARLGEPELAAEAIRTALGALDELVGSVSASDVLDRIFATFCLGK